MTRQALIPLTKEQQQLAVTWYGYVIKCARRAGERRGLPPVARDELVSVYTETLLACVRLWDQNQGVKFSTYLATAIARAGVIHYAERVGSTRGKVVRGIEPPTWVYFSYRQDPEDEREWGDNLADDSESPEELAIREDMGGIVRQALLQLPERTRNVLLWRMGEYTLADIGQELGMTREGVRLIEIRGLAELKRYIKQALLTGRHDETPIAPVRDIEKVSPMTGQPRGRWRGEKHASI